MRERIYAEVENGTDALLRAVSLLRKKEFQIVDLDLKLRESSVISDLYITVEGSEENKRMKARDLMEKLYDFKNIKCIEGGKL